MRYFEAPDGARWGVEVRSPGASNVMVVFHHPDGRSSRRNRYAWSLWSGAEARDVTARLDRAMVLGRLTDADLARLFRRSMPVNTATQEYAPAAAGGPPVGER
jgi:hypothetical protein